MRLPIPHKIVALTAVVTLVLSCSFFQRIGSPARESPGGGESSPDTPTQSAGAITPDSLDSLTDPRVEAALALRSVQFELETTYPGESSNRILASIDAAGSQRIETTTPVPEESLVTPGSPDWNVAEIFVVDGSAYTRMGLAGSAEPAPDETDALRRIMYNPTGPGMWLILMPEEAFKSTIEETKGGFNAVRYTVEGSLDGGEVWGELWVDKQSGALVGANLSVSEFLLRPVAGGTGGEALIYFAASTAEVAPISVP